MAYRYTGYAVSGVDVLIWILLTAGAIGFPVVVLAICCLKLHIRNNEKTKHLSHLLDGDVFDRKAKAAGFNRYFLNQHSLNESAENSQSGSPAHRKPTLSTSGERVLSQLGKPLTAIPSSRNANAYTSDSTSQMPIIINREIVNRDIYSISDSYENPNGTKTTELTMGERTRVVASGVPDPNYARISSSGFDGGQPEDGPAETTEVAIAASNTSGGENFEYLYSQVTKKPSTRNSSVRNDQALYMNTFYNN